MDVTIYNPARFDRVEYGDLVQGRYAPLRVSEIRQTETVELFGTRVDTGATRRERVEGDRDDIVRRLPTDDGTERVWAALMEAVGRGAQAFVEDQDGDDVQAAPWRIEGHSIIVDVDGRSYVIVPTVLDEEAQRAYGSAEEQEAF